MNSAQNPENAEASARRSHGDDLMTRERLDLSRHLPFRLSQVARMLSIGASRLFQKRFGLGIREWRVIAILGDVGPISAADMVGPAAFDKATVSRAISTLERRGIVKRLPDGRDGRKQLVHLTQKGADMHDRMVPLSRMRARVLESVLTKEERAQLFVILDKLTGQLDWLAHEEREDLSDVGDK